MWKMTFKFHTNRVRCSNVHFSLPYPNAKASLVSCVSTIMSSIGNQWFIVSNAKLCTPFTILIVLRVHTNVNQPAWLHPVHYSHRSREPGTVCRQNANRCIPNPRDSERIPWLKIYARSQPIGLATASRIYSLSRTKKSNRQIQKSKNLLRAEDWEI